MKYAKLINKELVFAKTQEQINEMIVTYPNNEQLISAGFKEVAYTAPEARLHYLPVSKLTETETQIIQSWEYDKMPQPDYAQLVERKIAEKYTIGAEIAINRKGRYNPDNADYISYLQWVEDAKNWAREQINEWENA